MQINCVAVFMVLIFIGTGNVAQGSIQEARAALHGLYDSFQNLKSTFESLQRGFEQLRDTIEDIQVNSSNESKTGHGDYRDINADEDTSFFVEHARAIAAQEALFNRAQEGLYVLVDESRRLSSAGFNLFLRAMQQKSVDFGQELPLAPLLQPKTADSFLIGTDSDDSIKWPNVEDYEQCGNKVARLSEDQLPILGNRCFKNTRNVDDLLLFNALITEGVGTWTYNDAFAKLTGNFGDGDSGATWIQNCINKKNGNSMQGLIAVFCGISTGILGKDVETFNRRKQLLKQAITQSILQPRSIGLPMALLLLKNGYTEVSFVRWVVGSLLRLIGEDIDSKHGRLLSAACLYEILKCIQNSQASDVQFLASIEEECSLYEYSDVLKGSFANKTKEIWVAQFPGDTFGTMGSYEGVISQVGLGARTSIEYAISFKRQQFEAEMEIARLQGAAAERNFQLEQDKKRRKKDLELKTVWVDPHAAKRFEAQEAQAEQDKKINSKVQGARSWSAVYVRQHILPWNNLTVDKNIIQECGEEQALASVLKVVCDTPKDIGKQLDIVQNVVRNLIINILQSQATLNQLGALGNESVNQLRPCLINMLAKLVYRLGINLNDIAWPKLPVGLKIGNINLLELYIKAYVAIEQLEEPKALDANVRSVLVNGSDSINQIFIGYLKEKYLHAL